MARPFRLSQLANKHGEHYVEPKRESRPQLVGPLKSDVKAGVQPTQEPGPKVPKQDDQKKKPADETSDKGEGNQNTEYSGGT